MDQNNDFWKARLKEWIALDPLDRISEVISGLIMVLAFTGTISVSTAGRKEVDDLLWAALGCNAAWGLVDAIMNLLSVFIDRERSISQLIQIRKTPNRETSRSIIQDYVSPLIFGLMGDEEIDQLGKKLQKLPAPDKKESLTGKDFLIAVQIFLLVFLSTLPVAIPFILVKDVALAMRISNAIALIMLFACGFWLAKYSGLKPLITASIFTAIGVFLVSLTIALGG